MFGIELHVAGTTRLTICVGRYALKVRRGLRGRVANYGEQVEWRRATPERRAILCPVLWAGPFGLVSIMRRAIPLTSEQHRDLKANDGFPRWDYMLGGPESPLEHKQSDWGYLDGGRLVALDYPASDILSRWEGDRGVNT